MKTTCSVQKISIISKTISTLPPAFILALLLGGCSYHVNRSHSSSSDTHLKLVPGADASNGSWESSGDFHARSPGNGSWLTISIEDAHSTWTTGLGFDSPRLHFIAGSGTVESSGPLQAAIQGAGGSLLLTGSRQGNHGSGTYALELLPHFVEIMDKLLESPPNRVEWLAFILHDIQPQEIREIRKAGYRLTAADVLRLSRHNVSAAYIVQLQAAGYHFSVEELTQLRRAGVSSEFASQLAGAGKILTAAEIISLRRAGISHEYFSGIKNIEPELDVEQMIQLRRAGVQPHYVSSVKNAGYIFSVEELIKLRRAGVGADYLAGLHSTGRMHLPVDLIIDLRRRGVSPETVQQIRAIQ
jgi:hypothetical protein